MPALASRRFGGLRCGMLLPPARSMRLHPPSLARASHSSPPELHLVAVGKAFGSHLFRLADPDGHSDLLMSVHVTGRAERLHVLPEIAEWMPLRQSVVSLNSWPRGAALADRMRV